MTYDSEYKVCDAQKINRWGPMLEGAHETCVAGHRFSLKQHTCVVNASGPFQFK